MSMRYTIQTAVTFEANEPKFLLVEWFGARDGEAGRCVGQFHTVEAAIEHAHERRANRPKLTVIENPRKRTATQEH